MLNLVVYDIWSLYEAFEAIFIDAISCKQQNGVTFSFIERCKMSFWVIKQLFDLYGRLFCVIFCFWSLPKTQLKYDGCWITTGWCSVAIELRLCIDTCVCMCTLKTIWNIYQLNASRCLLFALVRRVWFMYHYTFWQEKVIITKQKLIVLFETCKWNIKMRLSKVVWTEEKEFQAR